VRAIAHERWDIVEELLDAGADASFPKKYANTPEFLPPSPLWYMLGYPRPDLIRRLLRQGASVDEKYFMKGPTLVRAVKEGYIENVRVLIEAGADVNAASPDGTTAVFECFKEQDGELRVDLQMLEFLLSAGASVNQKSYSQTPLFRAALMGATDAIVLLVRHGADPNERYWLQPGEVPFVFDKAIREAIQNGGTALMLAADQGHLSAAKSLVKHGADPDIAVAGTTGEHTALSLARASGNLTLVKFLEELQTDK
jgi:ankyrin repeat protein